MAPKNDLKRFPCEKNVIQRWKPEQVLSITTKHSTEEKISSVNNATILPSWSTVWKDTKKLLMMESFINVKSVGKKSL